MSAARSDKQVQETFDMTSVGIVVPTYNAGSNWTNLEQALGRQGIAPSQVLIVDSSSTDGTDRRALAAGYRVIRIAKDNFNHGGTRRLASDEMPWATVLVYLTQDALPVGDTCFHRLCQSFLDPQVAVAYGRQLPRPQAGAIERHARLFNYPPEPSVRSYEDRDRLGIKAAFVSNSFAAYRRCALNEVGGFPRHVIASEDLHTSARLLLAGWKVAYAAEANVIHSHNLSLRAEFMRYFDIGVNHGRERWIIDNFGNPSGEGARFLRSELAYLLSTDKPAIPLAMVRTLNKLVAFNLGRREAVIPHVLRKRLTTQPGFWTDLRPEKAANPSTKEAPIKQGFI